MAQAMVQINVTNPDHECTSSGFSAAHLEVAGHLAEQPGQRTTWQHSFGSHHRLHTDRLRQPAERECRLAAQGGQQRGGTQVAELADMGWGWRIRPVSHVLVHGFDREPPTNN